LFKKIDVCVGGIHIWPLVFSLRYNFVPVILHQLLLYNNSSLSSSVGYLFASLCLSLSVSISLPSFCSSTLTVSCFRVNDLTLGSLAVRPGLFHHAGAALLSPHTFSQMLRCPRTCGSMYLHTIHVAHVQFTRKTFLISAHTHTHSLSVSLPNLFPSITSTLVPYKWHEQL